MRNSTLDIMKGVAIILVVYGHAIVKSLSESTALEDATFNIIYSFHMPLFFMVAGFLFYKTVPRQLDFWLWLKKKAVYLLIPHYLMDIGSYLIPLAFGLALPALTAQGWFVNSVLYLQGDWFLWTMFWVLVILALLVIMERKGMLWLGLGVILAIIYYNPSSPLFMGMAFINWQLPFALIGYFIAKYSEKLKRFWYVAPIMAIGYSPLMYLNDWNALSKHAGLGNPFYSPSLYFTEVGQAFGGICLVLCISYLLSKTKWSLPVRWLGRNSLAVYILSGYFLYFGVGTGTLKTLTGFAISLAICIVVILILSNIQWLNRWIPAKRSYA